MNSEENGGENHQTNTNTNANNKNKNTSHQTQKNPMYEDLKLDKRYKVSDHIWTNHMGQEDARVRNEINREHAIKRSI